MIATHAAAVVVEVDWAKVALVVPSVADLQRADLGARFSRSGKAQLRLILLVLVLNFVGVRVDARQMSLVLVAHSSAEQGAVLGLLDLDLATTGRALNDVLRRLCPILQIRDLSRRLTTSLSYSLDRRDDFVFLLGIWILLLIR